MKKIILSLLTILLSFSLFGCSKPIETTNIPKLDDLNQFYDTLSKKHKNLYARISKDKLDGEIAKIADSIETMSDAEFYYSLKHVLSLVGDAHTMLEFSDSKYNHLNALPFAIAKFEDGWYLMIINDQYNQYLGSKVLSINDVPIEDIYEKAKSIISFENTAWLDSQFSNAINFKEALEYLEIIKNDQEIYLTVESFNEGQIDIPIVPLTSQQLSSEKLARYERNKSLVTDPAETYRYLELNDDTFFVQYNSCQEDPNLPMKDFSNQVSEELANNSYSTIIIDLRYNSGGNSEIINPLLKILKKQSNIKFYTLIGSNTFSSGIINSLDTVNQLDSTLVGTPSGGNVNGYGELKFFNLKNTPIVISYSTKYFELIKDYDKDSLYPDIEVPHTIENYFNGVDEEVEWVLANK